MDGWIVTGYDKNGREYGVAFEFHGTVTHSHPDFMTNDEFENGINPINKRPNKEVYQDTLNREEQIRKHPQVQKLEVMWEHE